MALPVEGATRAPVMIQFTVFDSSMGTVLLVARDGSLLELDLSQQEAPAVRRVLLKRYPDAVESAKPFARLRSLLDQYFRGKRVDFDVPFDLSETTDFTRRVLLVVKHIPFGAVTSYGAIGMMLGYPAAARAVGQAVGRNPVPIVIPCHRVLRSDGALGGFGLGLDLKKRLLSLERVEPMGKGARFRKPLYAVTDLS
jgi:methylated-DNA-[protein]-cysteine S-methyltransferase